jgi:hypothetical protein
MITAIYEKQHTLSSVEAQTGRGGMSKAYSEQKGGAFLSESADPPIMVSKRMIDLARDNFFRSRGMPHKGSINSRTRIISAARPLVG